MTLIIGGYLHHSRRTPPRLPAKGFSYAACDAGRGPTGIYFAADSTISNGTKTLLSGFRKVYTVPIVLWGPYFVGEMFHGYREQVVGTECLLAFSGNTLTAQHLMNNVAEHLNKLRISYVRSGPREQIEYCVMECCEDRRNPMFGSVEFANDTFTDQDYAGLLTAERIAQSIEHSLASALKSARQYKLDAQGWESLFTGFAAAVCCPATGAYALYQFSMHTMAGEDGVLEARFQRHLIPEDGLVVLGKEKQFQDRAEAALAAVGARCAEAPLAMFDFLNAAIDDAHATGSKDIDRPAVLKTFDTEGIRTLRRRG